MNEKIFLVAQREWLENIRTKAFWIGLLIIPVFLILGIFAPALLSKTKAARAYVVIDSSAWLDEAVHTRAFAADLEDLLALRAPGDDVEPLRPAVLLELAAAVTEADASRVAVAERIAGLAAGDELPAAVAALADASADELRRWWEGLDARDARELDRGLSKARFRRVDSTGLDVTELNQRLGDDQLFAYILIEADPSTEDTPASYVSENLTDNDLERWYQRHATDALRDRRIAERKVDPELAEFIQAQFRMERSKLSDSGEAEEVSTEDRVRQWAPVAFVYLLWISIFSVAQMLLSNTIEEKSNRLMEVLLSSVSAFELMLGKILGIAATGVTMVGGWIFCLLGLAFLLPALAGGGAVAVNFALLIADPVYLASFLVYFVLGYLFYAALLVAIGSVCNTLKEAQNLQAPVMIILFLPLLLMMPVGQDPNGTLAVVFSYVPPMTPFVMMNRAAGDLALWEYVTTTLLLLVSVYLAIAGAAKIFRVGVLMTGKPPNLRELIRWLRTPVGAIPQRKQPGAAADES